jgi:hypothetical protein
MEILRSQKLADLVRRLARSLGLYLWTKAPIWCPWHVRYRLAD